MLLVKILNLMISDRESVASGPPLSPFPAASMKRLGRPTGRRSSKNSSLILGQLDECLVSERCGVLEIIALMTVLFGSAHVTFGQPV